MKVERPPYLRSSILLTATNTWVLKVQSQHFICVHLPPNIPRPHMQDSSPSRCNSQQRLPESILWFGEKTFPYNTMEEITHLLSICMSPLMLPVALIIGPSMAPVLWLLLQMLTGLLSLVLACVRLACWRIVLPACCCISQHPLGSLSSIRVV